MKTAKHRRIRKLKEEFLGVGPDHPARAEAEPAPATVIVSVTVAAVDRHEHDGTVYRPGEPITMQPELAERAIARGDVRFIRFNTRIQS